MSANTIPTFKTLTRAESSCLLSLPLTFTSRPPHLHLPVQHKNVKLHFSYSISLRPKTRFYQTVPFVAQTSDWAQQQDEGEESNPRMTFAELDEEPTRENQEILGFDDEDSDFESEVEDGSAEALRGVADVDGDEDGDFEGGVSDGEEGYSVSSENVKLFVGNLPFDIASDQLAHLFEEAGTVEVAEIIYDKLTETSRGFGFVTMSTAEEAEKAVDLFNRSSLGGRRLNVNKAVPKGSERPRPNPRPRAVSDPGYVAYVGNLDWGVDESRLEQVFSKHGKVLNAKIITDRDTGRSRGFGFVTMSSENELNDAVAALDGQDLEGRAIRTRVAADSQRDNL